MGAGHQLQFVLFARCFSAGRGVGRAPPGLGVSTRNRLRFLVVSSVSFDSDAAEDRSHIIAVAWFICDLLARTMAHRMLHFSHVPFAHATLLVTAFQSRLGRRNGHSCGFVYSVG